MVFKLTILLIVLFLELVQCDLPSHCVRQKLTGDYDIYLLSDSNKGYDKGDVLPTVGQQWCGLTAPNKNTDNLKVTGKLVSMLEKNTLDTSDFEKEFGMKVQHKLSGIGLSMLQTVYIVLFCFVSSF